MSNVVRRYYDRQVDSEWERLERPYRRLEMESTMRLIEEQFPASGRVADIGGGPGRYTVELLRRGYAVTLVDLSPLSIARATDTLASLGLVAECLMTADACDLHCLEDASYDAGLLLGPMYHLVEPEKRVRALAEFLRILKPGAPGIVAFINPWGVLRSGLTEFPELYHDHDAVAPLLATYTQIGEQPAFTEAAFVTPPDALNELESAGFTLVTRAGVEGFASGALGPVTELARTSPEAYANVLRLVRATCDHPAYRDSTEHLHVVVRRPEEDT